MNKENKALELFQYGYEDSVIAARSELPIEDVKELRKAWDREKEREMVENKLYITVVEP